MDAFQGYLEKMGSNFWVAAFIPSMVFVIGGMAIFGPLVPDRVLEQFQTTLKPFDQANFLFLLLITAILGFTLTSLNTFIYKLFEGYVLLDRIPFLHSLEKRRARRLHARRENLSRKIKLIEDREERRDISGLPPRTQEQIERIEYRLKRLKTARNAASTEYHLRYPPEENLILPTRLGNILRASEAYPWMRYHIDAVPLWPRMVHVVDDGFMSKLDYIDLKKMILKIAL